MVALKKDEGKMVIEGSSELFNKIKMNKLVIEAFNEALKKFGYDVFTEGLTIFCAKCRKALFTVEESYEGNKLTITIYTQDVPCDC